MTEPEIPKGVAKHVEEAAARLWEKWRLRELPYKPGDLIGQKYQVYGTFNPGHFGVVYLAYHPETKGAFVLKTFHDRYLQDAEIRKRFHEEANVWVKLERHAYLVRAYVVDEIAGRLYIVMEYIAPDEQERNTLHDYLGDKQPLDLAQSLRWAIQFCHGMEYAYSKGIKCHGDIKPDNIMISDNTVKISDFGLAKVVGEKEEAFRYKGATWYVAPEGRLDERSDIYSFGVVLYQMATCSKRPSSRGWFGGIPSVNGPMQSIVQRCLEKKPENRYPTFEALRNDLESLLKEKTGKVEKPPERKELEAWELVNKGASLRHLGHFDEAISCLNEALEINPRDALAYNNRGIAYAQGKGEYDRAIADFNKTLGINPRFAEAYTNRGLAYRKKGEYDRAIADYTKALEINPRHAEAYNNRGFAYNNKSEYDHAIADYTKALEINPRYAEAYYNRGSTYAQGKGEYDRAIADFNKALELNPRDALAYNNRGIAYTEKGEYDRAIADFNKALEINPRYAEAYNNRGLAYRNKDEYDCAIADYSKAIEINPRFAGAYYNRAVAYYYKGEYDKAWEDVRKAQGLGLQVHPGFLDALRQATGRRR